MNFLVDDGLEEPNFASSAKLKTRPTWFNYESSKVLLEDRQSGVDGGLEFHQFAVTNGRDRSESTAELLMC